ncbi:hypothetical protein DITRI_Ditri10aG0080800 [Diplodiscus trichospermus]
MSETYCACPVVRDSLGAVKLSAARSVELVLSPLHVELLAVHFGLEIAFKLGVDSIVIESDSIVVVAEIRKDKHSMCVWGEVVSDINHRRSPSPLVPFCLLANMLIDLLMI